MYKPRHIDSCIDWLDETGIKIYTVSVNNKPVEQAKYIHRLKQMKLTKPVDLQNTPAFVIFHDGATCDYLVLVWWANDNEIFTSVSVNTNSAWVEDAKKYSFCLYDLEIMWTERNIYIETIDCQSPSLQSYRKSR